MFHVATAWLENQLWKQLQLDQCTKRNLGVFVVVQTTRIAFAGHKMGDLAGAEDVVKFPAAT